ncbi:MAG TPA: amino acid adenylation domain-containing protein [Herpetosiphonaceae bacterium]
MRNYSANASTPHRDLVSLLRWRAVHQTDTPAYTFLLDGETTEVMLTYGELDRHARAIAAALQQIQAPGERALLLYPPGLEYITAFFGCLYAACIAVPAYPLHQARLHHSVARLEAIAENARPLVALTTSAMSKTMEAVIAQSRSFKDMRCLATDTIADDRADQWEAPHLSDAAIAFLQYTSGSTSTPKGVMVSHANLMQNEHLITHAFEHTAQSVIVGWLPLYHDMGLIGNVLQPLYIGARCILMSPMAFLQRPMRWLHAISRYRATTSGGPNFAYDLCARKIPEEQRVGLDLSSWAVAFNGAEPIHHETIERFTAAFAPYGFRHAAWYPCYGLAEATLFVTGGPRSPAPMLYRAQKAALEGHQVIEAADESQDAQILVSAGQIHGAQDLLIVDPQTQTPHGPDQVGEIWLAGPCVASGYWERPQDTRDTFQARLSTQAAASFLRTGDLGFLHDDRLFVTGRLKDLIIIRGRNHYPQDIEYTVQGSHPALRAGAGAAFTIDGDPAERLVIVQEVERQARALPPGEMIAAIRRAVAEHHELQVYAVVLLMPGSIPKTSSGKIQRHLCRARFLADTLEGIARDVLNDPDARDAAVSEPGLPPDWQDLAPTARQASIEAYLQRQVARSLHGAAQRIATDQPLSSLGLDSLMAIELKHQIEVDFKTCVALEHVLSTATIAELAAAILADVAGSAHEPDRILPAPDTQPVTHAASPGQRALWIIHQLDPDSAAYTIARALRICAPVDVSALQRAFGRIIERHPSLRTTFALHHAEPVQHIHPTGPAIVQVTGAAAWSEAIFAQQLHSAAYQPFDLTRGPLIRIHLFTRSAHESVLLISIHHIIADFQSLTVVLRELDQLYRAETTGAAERALPLTPPQYMEYAQWQRQMLAGPQGAQLAAYWQRQLRPEGTSAPMILELPVDRPRPSIQTYAGATYALTLVDLTQPIKAHARSSATTPFTVVLSAFQALLHRYTSQRTILVGTPMLNRDRASLMDLVGYVVNPVVVRADIDADMSYHTLLTQTRQRVLAAMEHQAYPFASLVAQLQPVRDLSYSPVFQVMFLWHSAFTLPDGANLVPLALNQAGAQLRIAGLSCESVAVERRASQFDLTLAIGEGDAGLEAVIEYNTALFEAETIARMAEGLRMILQTALAEPHVAICDIPLVTEPQRRLMLAEWQATTMAYPSAATLHQLFEAQAARTPDAVALSDRQQTMTYRELDRRANKLARYLRRQGVGLEAYVGVCLEPSLWMVVGVLAILKADAAYVPLDPAYPRERLDYMLKDASIRVLLTQEHLLGAVPGRAARTICLDSEWTTIDREPADALHSSATPDSVAYVIYTSGSTGQPKGVLGLHRATVNRCNWMWQRYPFQPSERCCLKTSLNFVDSVWEIFGPLLQGVALEIVPEAIRKDPSRLLDLLAEAEVSRLVLVPSLLRLLLDHDPDLPRRVPRLKLWITSGEALSLELARRFWERLPDGTLLNLYGSSEVAADVTWSDTRADAALDGHIAIGRPIANTQIYVLDRQLQPVPIGVVGEIFVGGIGLARGYLNDPALTAGKFIPHPLSGAAGIPPGARLYRTGDRGRFLPSGGLEYCGRADDQVKIRGFRVAVREVEAALAAHPDVQAVAILARGDHGAPPALVAYVVPHAAHAVTTSQLRDFLHERLPEYMIPSTFVLLDALPLTPNGKLDRQALPAPTTLRPALDTRYASPRTVTERTITAIWQDVLQIDTIGVEDNFFDLGGHSLTLAQVGSRLQEAFGRPVQMVDLFKYPTISALATFLAQTEPAQVDVEEVQRLAQKEKASIQRRKRLMKGTENG